MSYHTPGPWGWEFFTNHAGVVEEFPICLSGPGPLSDVLLASGDPDTGRIFIRCDPTDRALISAAPDLLAACEAILRLQEEHDGESFEDVFILAEDIARAAVAKARGTS